MNNQVMILNFCHRNFPVNYGQTLLAYALEKKIKAYGYNPVTVSYTERSEIERKRYLERYLFPDLKTVESKSFSKVTQFVKTNMNQVSCFQMNEVEQISELCDIWVAGGDVLWRKKYFDSIFALDFGKEEKLRLSYATSIYGYDKEDSLKYTDFFRKVQQSLDYISTREIDTVNLFERLLGCKKVECVIDPVFLLTSNEWRKLEVKCIEDEDYLLIYIIENEKSYRTIINDIRNKTKCEKIVIIPTNSSWAEKSSLFDGVGVEEFIWLFDHAKYVITDSYHGVAFSIIFQKQFSFLKRKNFDAIEDDFRVENLLNNCMINHDSFQEKGLPETINYEGNIRARLNTWIDSSEKYLINALKGNENECKL